ncbi:TPA: DNA-binding protein [Campylobacter fetus]|nr:DNA-binding protein [Campylobacter fetus]
MKVSIKEAAEILGITKEAVYNRIRRNSLKSEEINGVKYVILDDKTVKKPSNKTIKTKNQDEFTNFLLSQIENLKEINKQLSADKDRIFKEKEQLLLAKNEEVKEIYKNSDERLKRFLQMLENSLNLPSQTQKPLAIDVEYEEIKDKNWITLSDFLLNLKIKPKKLKKLQNYLLKCVKKGKLSKLENGVIYIKAGLSYEKVKEKM